MEDFRHKMLQELNNEQMSAVTHLDGPLLIFAGAGSGKTRVITNRIAWLIGEKKVAPWNICAITFTNKAASEMRERVDYLVGPGSASVHVATFHSTCARILRQCIEQLEYGYKSNFDIYDRDDCLVLIKDICRARGINTKLHNEKMFLSMISHRKDELIGSGQDLEAAVTPREKEAAAISREEASAVTPRDREEILISEVYKEYQKRLRRSNALDFDDLIFLTVQMFRAYPDVLEYWQDRWHYLMVDEYQDTNKAQFVLVSLLARKYRNLCVVGDDDQSIYRFRGAELGNILNFEKIFPDATVVRLEQNYRSTQYILEAANAVISNNAMREKKTLWTGQGKGEKIHVRRFNSSRDEARFIADDIARMKRREAFSYVNCAVLYRTNSQSREMEEQLLYENIPYTVIGGTNFYARREIKDILAYLKVIANESDDVSVRRIINVPKRGIGAVTLERVGKYAASHEMSYFDVCSRAVNIPEIGRSGCKLREFSKFVRDLREKAASMSVSDVVRLVLDQTGYERALRLEGTSEANDRLQNLDELINKAVVYEESFNARSYRMESTGADGIRADGIGADGIGADGLGADGLDTAPSCEGGFSGESPGERVLEAGAVSGEFFDEEKDYHRPDIGDKQSTRPNLEGFLQDVALVADIDSLGKEEDRVLLMTLHSAKGLEFDNVYISGMDEGLFPGYRSIVSCNILDMEEERRLCYVGITRAKKRLTLTGADMRMLRGQEMEYHQSRFINELPAQVIDTADMTRTAIRKHEAFSQKIRDVSIQRRQQTAFHIASGVSLAQTDIIGYDVGDTVRHFKFGEGVVRDIREGGRDKEVTVDFEKYGVKKMFAGFARLVKVRG